MVKPVLHSLNALLVIGSLLVSITFMTSGTYAASSEDSAVILIYHRFGEGKYPSTNITLEQFEAQLQELKQDKYNVVPLDTIITAFHNKTPLPPRTIAITIDDAYLSILENAWPRLKQANFPFTIFVATEPVNQNIPGYLSWSQIRELTSDPLVSIGHHGHTHSHMVPMNEQQVSDDIETANAIYQKELGYIPDIFAYPFGEFNPQLQNILKKNGIRAAFGQYSRTANSNSDLFALPRFSFNEKYSTMKRFKLIANSRALPVRDILPINPVISQNPPHIGFTVDDNISNLTALDCYPSHINKSARISRVGQNRIEIRFDKPFPPGRNRINCTMPGPNNRWYWFGLPFFVD